MPTYEYECGKCQHTFERFQSITDKPVKTCPKCRGRVKRLLGAGAGILFKGSGFYQTDYRSRSYTEAAKRDSSDGGSKSSDKSSEKKTSTAVKDTKASSSKAKV